MKPALSEQDRTSPSDWQQFTQGQALADAISRQLQPWWQQIFGYYMLKVGDLSCQLDISNCKIQHHIGVGRFCSQAMLLAESDALPVTENSVDAVLLSHCLEYTADPHHVVREAHRVLVPDGYLLLSGINPYSSVGLLKWLPGLAQKYPWHGRFFSASRIKDWLHLIGFEVLSEQRFFCSAMLAKEYKATRWQLWNEQYMNYFGASYLLVARKRELPLTPIKPKWQLSPAFAQQVKGVSARQRSD
jgi:SAM-dependent methyltransferase